jgi:hypothetical protein
VFNGGGVEVERPEPEAKPDTPLSEDERMAEYFEKLQREPAELAAARRVGGDPAA